MFDKLEYIYAVYKEGTFSKAAEKLFISQPSLSAAVKKEEEKLGAPLFVRKSGGVTLTEFGREYINAAERIMRINEDFQRRVDDIFKLGTGHLTVGGSNYISSYMLPDIVSRFSALHPGVTVELVEGNSALLCEKLEEEQVDVIIDSFEDNDGTFDSIPLASEHIFLCVPEDNPINKTLIPFRILPEDIHKDARVIDTVPPVDLRVFGDEGFILLKPGNDMRYHADRLFEQAHINPPVLFSVDQLNISYALTTSSIGCSFVTDTLFRFGKLVHNVVLYNLSGQYAKRVLYVAGKKNRYNSCAAREFIRLSEEIVKKRFER